jgi:UDP-glucose 4-epimerase
MACLLVTGAAGYIGSHIAVLLLQQGHKVIAIDNLCNSHLTSLHRAVYVAGSHTGSLHFQALDIQDFTGLQTLLNTHKPDAVLHFAGLKSLPESLRRPLIYYEVNISGTLSLLRACKESNVRTFIFSSSAAVYGNPSALPINEEMPTSPHNPYAYSKQMIEQCLKDLAQSNTDWRIANLRYFNPVGAHSSSLIGEASLTPPTNLMPLLAQVALNQRQSLSIFGRDWPTPDGTCIRDYIHVMDLAWGHLAALERLLNKPGCFTVNLGTGQGHSVLELLQTFEKICGKKIPHTFTARRAGDIAACYADVTLAKNLLGWEAKYSLQDMCEDAWHWYKNNPYGYEPVSTCMNAISSEA